MLKKFKDYRGIIVKFVGMEERSYRYSKRLFKSLSNDKLVEYLYVV